MTKQSDLFETKANQERDGGHTQLRDRVELASYRLAVDFTEDDQLPVRYRKRADSAQKKRKGKKDSEVEKRFRGNVKSWRVLIETMLAKLKHDQAWRFISLSPQMDETITKVTDSTDFCDFIDYMVLRRDKQKCDADELGNLATLSVAFQREIEKHIQA